MTKISVTVVVSVDVVMVVCLAGWMAACLCAKPATSLLPLLYHSFVACRPLKCQKYDMSSSHVDSTPKPMTSSFCSERCQMVMQDTRWLIHCRRTEVNKVSKPDWMQQISWYISNTNSQTVILSPSRFPSSPVCRTLCPRSAVSSSSALLTLCIAWGPTAQAWPMPSTAPWCPRSYSMWGFWRWCAWSATATRCACPSPASSPGTPLKLSKIQSRTDIFMQLTAGLSLVSFQIFIMPKIRNISVYQKN